MQVVDASGTHSLSPPIFRLMPSSRTSVPATTKSELMELRHRGFDLVIRMMPGRYGDQSYGYVALHRGHPLHESGGEFGSAASADKAARQLIDDALSVFDNSLAHLEENEA